MVGKMVPGFLLNEVADYSNLNYLVEAKEDRSKSYKIRGIFMESGKKNRNGRIYPKEILEREVNNYYKEFVVTKRAISRGRGKSNKTTL
jgi:hypothetical protein